MTRFALVALFMAGTAQAAVQKFPVKPQDRVIISFAKAQVSVSPAHENFVTLSLGANCHDLIQETKEGELILREPEILKPRGEGQPCQAQILLPAVPLQLHVLDGLIQVQKTSSDLLLHVQKGRVIVKESTGSATVHVLKGDVQISDFQGRVRLDLQQASATVKNLQGDLDFQSLGGEHLLEKTKGNLRIVQALGTMKVVGGQGALQLETVRSTLSTQAFSGRIEGSTQEGTLSLALTQDPDVSLKSQAGRIILSVPPGSGASVNLVTQEGDLIGPATMPVAKEGSLKMIRGRLRGEAGRGSLIVRSQEGNITLK